jgi:hypothetical protein
MGDAWTTTVTKMATSCFVPLCCIWFPDALGSMVGGDIDRPSNPTLVWFLGWTALTLPIWTGALSWLASCLY